MFAPSSVEISTSTGSGDHICGWSYLASVFTWLYLLGVSISFAGTVRFSSLQWFIWTPLRKDMGGHKGYNVEIMEKLLQINSDQMERPALFLVLFFPIKKWNFCFTVVWFNACMFFCGNGGGCLWFPFLPYFLKLGFGEQDITSSLFPHFVSTNFPFLQYIMFFVQYDPSWSGLLTFSSTHSLIFFPFSVCHLRNLSCY